VAFEAPGMTTAGSIFTGGGAMAVMQEPGGPGSGLFSGCFSSQIGLQPFLHQRQQLPNR